MGSAAAPSPLDPTYSSYRSGSTVGRQTSLGLNRAAAPRSRAVRLPRCRGGDGSRVRHRRHPVEPITLKSTGGDVRAPNATHSPPKAAQKASQHPTASARTASFNSLVTPQTQRGCAARCEQAQPRAILHSGRRGIRRPRSGRRKTCAAQPRADRRSRDALRPLSDNARSPKATARCG